MVGGGYYSPYYDPYFYGDPWYGDQYPYPIRTRPYGYGYRTYEPDASVRLEVKPKEAEVFVDGYYAGIVDDFDGTFQRLHVPPGEHEIELWLDGYRTVRQKVYLTQDNTFKVQVPDGAARRRARRPSRSRSRSHRRRTGSQPRTQPQQPHAAADGPRPHDAAACRRRRRTIRAIRRCRAAAPNAPRGRPGNGAYGTLAIKVQPGDARGLDRRRAVARTRRTGSPDRRSRRRLAHRRDPQVRLPDLRDADRRPRGQTTPLNVSLRGEQ